MIFEEIKKNIDTEIRIIKEISGYIGRIDNASPIEKKLLLQTIDALLVSLKLINKTIPDLIKLVGGIQPLPDINESVSQQLKTGLEKVQIKVGKVEFGVTLRSKDKQRFLKELSISENLLKRIKKKQLLPPEEKQEFKKTSGYLKLSNKAFLKTSKKLVERGYFDNLGIELKRANLDILLETYVSMMLFTSFLSIFVGIFIMIFFMFFSIKPDLRIAVYSGDFGIRLAKIFWIPIITPIITFLALYFYPNTEKTTLEKRIDQELPFAVIHMSAISGSGIEPTQIFKIIGLSKEYKYLRKEIRKVLNQINLYGYDVVTALSNVSRSTPSSKLSELLSGLGTTITSGGNLKDFFEKRAETLLVGYRLEREKYTKLAETFMDLYISVVIAAPMILMLLLIMMYVVNIGASLTPMLITILIISAISFINIIFLIFLHIKQPSY